MQRKVEELGFQEKILGIGSRFLQKTSSKLYNNYRLWNSVTIQGRVKYSQYVTKFKLMFSLDGKTFEDYQGGKVFAGNTDPTTKVRHDLEPFYARAIRLYPLGFNVWPSLRWEVTHLV